MHKLLRAIQPLLLPGNLHIIAGHKELFCVTKSSVETAKTFTSLKKTLSAQTWNHIRSTSVIVSFQNGIGHTDDDFIKLVGKINQAAKRHQLLVSIYNPTQGPLEDARHVALQKMNKATPKLESFNDLLIDLLEFMSHDKKGREFTHFAHSEAGIICENTLRSLNDQTLQKTTQIMNVVTLGSPRAVSKQLVKTSVNIYSENDYLIIPFVKIFENNPNFVFKEAKDVSSKEQKRFQLLDHSLDGQTYFNVIKSYLDKGRIDESLFTHKHSPTSS